MKTIGLCAIVAKEFEAFVTHQKQLGNIPKEERIKIHVTFNPQQDFVIKFTYSDGDIKILTI
jgi:hypothetical protein